MGAAAVRGHWASGRISGQQAAEIGLVDRSVASDQLEAAVDELAAEIVRNSAGTNRIVKQLVTPPERRRR